MGEVSEEVATEVLVFMLVGVIGHWKLPVAYFCTNGLTASTQKSLVLSVIEELQQTDIQVCK